MHSIKNALNILEETEERAALRRRQQELPTAAEIAIKEVGNLLDAHRVAAEIITNIVSNDEEGNEKPLLQR